VRLCFVVESGTDVRLVDGLAERNEVSVLARRILGGVAVNHEPAASVRIEIGPASRPRFAGWAAVRLLARGARFDHVLVQGYGLAALAVNAVTRVTGTPATMLVCSPIERYYRSRSDVPQPGRPFSAAALAAVTAVARVNARLGRRYVVLSRYLATVVAAHGTRLPTHVVPVYGVDTERFRPASEPKAALRARLGLPADGALLFFSSRVAPEKDAATLLSALVALRAEGRDVRLLHRSGGWRELLALADRAGVGDRVIATDAVHPERDLPASYQAADLCVQASRDEGLGFSPLEALACEVPVVATAVGGLRETIVDGETGWTYPVGDAAALARAIGAALDDPAEARRRAAAGRRMVRERFESAAAFARLQAVLEASAP
jgi:glycosyltransferase involved in cell wall biosynthesis